MGLIKLANSRDQKAKKHGPIAKYTQPGAILQPWMLGAGAGGLISTVTGNRIPALIGSMAGLGVGVYNYNKLSSEGEFDKRILPHHRGTKTGWGAVGSSMAGLPGSAIYEGVKNHKHRVHSRKNK